MNKLPLANSTQRNSVNSSFSTVKNIEFSSFYDTANKQMQGKRFSYQEINNHQETSQKENMRFNSTASMEMNCINHQNKSALFTALETSDDPMFLCERCAIMVASKGFEISKVQERKVKKQNLLAAELKKEAGETFTNLKMKKNQALEKLHIFASKLEKKAEFIEEYFSSLQEFFEQQKLTFLREIMLRRKKVDNLRQESNSFYLNSLERVKEISMEAGILSQLQLGELSKELKELKKSSFQIAYEQLKYPMRLKNINVLCQEVSNLIKPHDYKQLETDLQFKTKCEQENSEIRSLQLSFEEDNNFTLNAQETNRTGEL